MKCFALSCFLCVPAACCVADRNSEIAYVLAQPGDLVLADSFDRTEPGDMWDQVRGEWKIVNGEVIGKELSKDKHAAVFHCLKQNRDSIVRFSFKLDGAQGFHFSLNHKRGHLFRVLVSADGLVVRTDRDKKDDSSKSEVLGTAKGTFEQGKWYTMQVEMVGDQVSVVTDNGLAVRGRHPRLDTEKHHYRFILKGEFLVLDDLQVRAVK